LAKVSSVKRKLSVLITGFLLLPFLIVFAKVDSWGLPATDLIFKVLGDTVLQSALSAVFSLAIGIVGAMGLASMGRWSVIGQFVFLFPYFVPVLFVIVGAMSVVSPFPFGLWGIVLIHTILNAGAVSVALYDILRLRIGSFVELALIEGVGRFRFLTRIALPYLRKEMAYLFLFVFSLCFASFAVPLIVSGGSYTTLELWIYEKIRIENNWSHGLGLAALQSVFVLALVLLIKTKTSPKKESFLRNMSLLKAPIGLVIPALMSLGVVYGQIKDFGHGWNQVFSSALVMQDLLKGFWGSLVIGGATGAFLVLLFWLIAYSLPTGFFQRFLVGYVAPSTVIIGFSLVILRIFVAGPIVSNLWVVVSIVVACTISFLTTFYRMGFSTVLEGLKGQVLVAKTMGAEDSLIHTKIVWRQALPTVGLLAGIGSFWVCGDFALSGIIADEPITLALIASALLGSYRIEAAAVVTWMALGVGLFWFLVYWRLGHVFGKKSRL
jgi:thiamine transport system permease protein